MSLREDYDVPAGTGRLPALRMWIVMLVVPAAALVAWLVLPDSAVTVAILALAVLAAVFAGVHWVMTARGLNRPPGRDPRPRA
jgi:membrane protein implicated in regulation of membrane protease activity